MLKSPWAAASIFACAAVVVASAPAAAEKRGPVEAYDARAIAFETGIVEIKEMELDDGIWEIEGWDEQRREVELELDARDGRILKIRRD